MALARWIRRRFGRDPHDAAATALYAAAIEQARRPVFYQDPAFYEDPALNGGMGVPDTVEGRYDLLAVHVFVVLRRLRDEGEGAKDLAQRLFDVMFRDMEANLRELGVGDLKVGKKVRELAEQFYGRAHAYEEALSGDAEEGALARALGRNVFGDEAAPGARPLAAYVRRATGRLAELETPRLVAGEVRFPDPIEEAHHVSA